MTTDEKQLTLLTHWLGEQFSKKSSTSNQRQAQDDWILNDKVKLLEHDQKNNKRVFFALFECQATYQVFESQYQNIQKPSRISFTKQ